MSSINQRGVSERFKVQSWKGCVGAIPPWVRIPSPLYKTEQTFVLFCFIIWVIVFVFVLFQDR